MCTAVDTRRTGRSYGVAPCARDVDGLPVLPWTAVDDAALSSSSPPDVPIDGAVVHSCVHSL